MRIVIAGGHGQIALRLERMLAARGDEPVAVIRKPELDRGTAVLLADAALAAGVHRYLLVSSMGAGVAGRTLELVAGDVPIADAVNES